jgi:acetyltransferase
MHKKDVATFLKRCIAKLKLRNGKRVLLRPIRPSDEPLMDELFKTFSEETVMYRFFGVIKEMSHKELARYCNVDHDKEIAIVAEIDENGQKRLIGVVRLAIEPDGKTGEIAFVVGDPWQGLGLGSKMVDYLIEIGKAKKLDTLYALMLRDNYRAIQFLQKRGFKIEYLEGDNVRGILDLRSYSPANVSSASFTVGE